MSLRLGFEYLEGGGGDVDCTGMFLGEIDLGKKLSCFI